MRRSKGKDPPAVRASQTEGAVEPVRDHSAVHLTAAPAPAPPPACHGEGSWAEQRKESEGTPHRGPRPFHALLPLSHPLPGDLIPGTYEDTPLTLPLGSQDHRSAHCAPSMPAGTNSKDNSGSN